MTFRGVAQGLGSAFVALGVATVIHAQDVCVDGLAAGVYPCENVDLMSFMNSPALGAAASVEYNDIWGWTDPLDGKEYVLLGRTDGTSFVDISDPLNPINLGFLPTHTVNSIWRDVKVNGNWAYIVAESSGHGMQVFDLTRLRNVANPPQVFTSDAHYPNFGNAHNIVINAGVARAYAVGSNTFSGGLHIVNISNPLNPVIMGDFADDGYTHDAQVVTYNGPDAVYQGRQIAFCSNENTLTIVDVNNPVDCIQLSSQSYQNVAYAHQGWLTEDHRYFLMGDELDEINFGGGTRTIIFDVQDLNNPVVIGQFVSSVPAIDHNMYTKGNLVYQSNYRAGLRILDMENVASGSLNEVAFFDVFPASNSNQFNGSWSNYPYFESGVVAVSHIEEGLFLLRPNFLRTELVTNPLCEGGNAVVDVTIVSGFDGPVQLSVSNGLPAGTTASFSANNVGAGTYQLTLSNLPASGSYVIEVTAVGPSQTFVSSVALNVIDCGAIVPGCTNPAAQNFNPAANFDDGSCIIPCVDVNLSLTTDCWGEEVSWQITNDQGTVVASVAPNTYGDQQTFTFTECLPVGCYTFSISDSFGDGMAGSLYGSCGVDGNYQMVDGAGNVLFTMGAANYGAGTTHAFCLEAPCFADFDQDGLRSVNDILILLSQFGCSANCTTDLDGNGQITTGDLLLMLGVFGTICP